MGDLVDIVISNDYFKTKLILTNTKNRKNGEIYKKVLVELKERAAVRNEEVPFDHVQLRTKLKKAIAECKKTALTIKNSKGCYGVLVYCLAFQVVPDSAQYETKSILGNSESFLESLICIRVPYHFPTAVIS